MEKETSFCDFKELIKVLPVENQAALIKKDTWYNRFPEHKDLFKDIFTENEIEISRNDILHERDCEKKLLMTLMWGYPIGGRGHNMQKVLQSLPETLGIMSANQNNDFDEQGIKDLIKKLENIKGMGMSTWSKLLFFFNISIDKNKCQIYDEKIVASLNRKQFSELNEKDDWKHSSNYYYKYVQKINGWANELEVLPEQLEIFLFYYNFSYKL